MGSLLSLFSVPHGGPRLVSQGWILELLVLENLFAFDGFMPLHLPTHKAVIIAHFVFNPVKKASATALFQHTSMAPATEQTRAVGSKFGILSRSWGAVVTVDNRPLSSPVES